MLKSYGWGEVGIECRIPCFGRSVGSRAVDEQAVEENGRSGSEWQLDKFTRVDARSIGNISILVHNDIAPVTQSPFVATGNDLKTPVLRRRIGECDADGGQGRRIDRPVVGILVECVGRAMERRFQHEGAAIEQ